MKHAKDKLFSAARWLVVLTASFVVLAGNVFAEKPAAPSKPCTESCAATCPCCVSKPAQSNAPTPLAPSSSTRTTVAKDFQLIPLLNALLAPECNSTPVIAYHSSITSHVSVPIFVRHCTFLI
jgi:hypothetical protein